MTDCQKCVHMELCYDICETSFDSDDNTCHYCKSPTCPEATECKFFTPTVDAVPRGAYDQVAWERDVAIYKSMGRLAPPASEGG